MGITVCTQASCLVRSKLLVLLSHVQLLQSKERYDLLTTIDPGHSRVAVWSVIQQRARGAAILALSVEATVMNQPCSQLRCGRSIKSGWTSAGEQNGTRVSGIARSR